MKSAQATKSLRPAGTVSFSDIPNRGARSAVGQATPEMRRENLNVGRNLGDSQTSGVPHRLPDGTNETTSSGQAAVRDDGKGAGPADLQREALAEIEELKNKVMKATLPELLREKALKMITRLTRMAKYGSYSGEYELIEKYVDWIISIPWDKSTQDNLDLEHVRQVLDANHYGLEGIKARILEYLAVMKLRQGGVEKAKNVKGAMGQEGKVPKPAYATETKTERQVRDDGSRSVSSTLSEEMMRLQGSVEHAPILCFVGLQGIGKTSMAKSIAQAMGRKFIRVSLGAMGSVYEIRGRSRAYLDAEPGQIVKSLVRTGVNNPLILLDEIDKVAREGGVLFDIMAALLEILDPEQNSTFMDHYVDYPVDLSKCFFICTANNLGGLSTALMDRLEVIRFSSYTDEQKRVIAQKYLWPKILKAVGLSEEQIEFSESVWPVIIRPLGFDAGIRQLERNLTALARKVAFKIVRGEGKKFVITPANVKEFLPEDIGTMS